MEQNYITKEVYEQIKDFKSFYLSEEQKAIVDKLILNEELKERYKMFTLCKECYQPCSGSRRWCPPCMAKHFQDNFKNWTSGNTYIDQMIRDTQLKAENNFKILEWIEYDKFYDIEYVAKGGFGTVYKAKWKNGYLVNWDVENNKWKRWNDNDPTEWKVALKCLNDSQEVSAEFIKELHTIIEINGSVQIVQCFGVSKDPETGNFIIVMDYLGNSLRHYLDKNYVYWEYKLYTLQCIAKGLIQIHKRGLVHRDLHSGNILKGGLSDAQIADLGLSRPTRELNRDGKNEVIGVLPYIAPEVLRGRDYTQKSDIYSFGILCYEVVTGLPPYHDMAHDSMLILRIIKENYRPEFNIKVPKLLLDLINRCWDLDPSKRPDAANIHELINSWREDLSEPNYDTEFYKQYDEADEYNIKHRSKSQQTSTPIAYVSHPQAVYTSRIFKPFAEASEGLNLVIQESMEFDMDDDSDDGDDNDDEEWKI